MWNAPNVSEWMVMNSTRRKSLFIASVVGLAAAFAYHASGAFPSYEYRTDVFVGEYAIDDGFQSFEPVSTTELFIRDTLAIAPTPEELRKFGVREVRSDAIIRAVEGGKSIRIHSLSTESGTDRIKAVHQFIVDGILARLKPRADHVRVRLQNRLTAAEEVLKSASTNLNTFSEIVADAKTSEARTREQVRQLADRIASLDRTEGLPPSASASRGEVMGELSGLNIRSQLALYQKLGLAEIPFMRADSARTAVALDQTAAQARQAIRDLTEQIGVFREPAVALFAMRSESPTKPGLLLLLMVGLVAGLAAYLATQAILGRVKG